MHEDRIAGCILGVAVGDSIGLPYEGLSRQRALKLLGRPDRHRFFFGHGMVSDDTEHTCLVAEAFIGSHGDLYAFRRELARRFRLWLLGVPAGIGFATLRSIVRLWMGFDPERSGVFSAGNGPAVRAAVLGVTIHDPVALRGFVRVSSRITHTDPKAEIGAFAVALAAQMAAQDTTVTPKEYLSRLECLLDHSGREFVVLVARAVKSAGEGESTAAFADSLGLSDGVGGYVYHCVPVVLHAWFSHPRDCHTAIETVISCGGDTDSTAAVVGGIVGASVGRSGIPNDWLSALMEWPRTVTWMEQLAADLATAPKPDSPRYRRRLPLLGLLSRNLFFLAIVLCHGFRRLMPPY